MSASGWSWSSPCPTSERPRSEAAATSSSGSSRQSNPPFRKPSEEGSVSNGTVTTLASRTRGASKGASQPSWTTHEASRNTIAPEGPESSSRSRL